MQNSENKKNVLIMAAGDVRDKFHYLKSNSPSPALIPVHTIPLISYVLNIYSNNEDLNLHLITEKEYVDHIKSELNLEKLNINICSIDRSNGVVSSIKEAIKQVSYAKETIIHPVTTILLSQPQCNEVYIADEQSNNTYWSNIIFSETGKVEFCRKKTKTDKNGYAFTGVFCCQTKDLLQALKETSITNDLLAVIENLSKTAPLNYKKIDWLDCGHEINYYELKTKVIASRFFNNLKIVGNGIVRKSSSDIKKMKAEKLYISMLPPALKSYFPRLQDNNIDTSGYYDMEYYGYPNISELMLYWGLEQTHWQRIFKGFKTILADFYSYKHSIGIASYTDFYVEKLKTRISLFEKQHPANKEFIDNELTVNDLKCKSIKQLLPKIEKKLNSLYNEDDFCIMHGDFCFNNILFDLQTGIMRLIDPRGDFGERCSGVYGDFKYDLAKLAHSSMGCYDYIVNNIFKLEEEKQYFSYKFNMRDNQDILDGETVKLINYFEYKYEDIVFLMGLLFITMCPLHSNSEEKQKTMFLHGIKIMNEVLL